MGFNLGSQVLDPLRFFAGSLESPDWLETSRVLGNFGSRKKATQRKYLKTNQPRDVAIYLCRQLSGQTGKSLGEFFGKVSGAAISMRTKHVEKHIVKSGKPKRDLVKLKKKTTTDNE